jgi:hypothetical protein
MSKLKLIPNATFHILLPETDSEDPDDILSSPARSSVFFDENLHFYVKLNPNSDNLENDILTYLESVDIQIIAKMGFIDFGSTIIFNTKVIYNTNPMTGNL